MLRHTSRDEQAQSPLHEFRTASDERAGPGNEAKETMPVSFHVYTSLAPRPMTMVFGIGTRLLVCMHTTFKNGVLRNGQQLGSAVNNFIKQGEFEAMKTLSGHIAPHCVI